MENKQQIEAQEAINEANRSFSYRKIHMKLTLIMELSKTFKFQSQNLSSFIPISPIKHPFKHQLPFAAKLNTKPKTTAKLTVTTKRKPPIEGVSDELNDIACYNLDFAYSRRRVCSAFAKVQQQLVHCLFKEKAMNDVAAMHSSTSATFSSSSLIFTNYPLISALVAFSLAQSIKFFTTWFKESRWDIKQLVRSGGMPSSHSAIVTALAAAIGFQEGFGGPLFATALVLACIVMYDATGVRLQAGLQAEVLNQIVYELPAEHPLAESRPLRELLGHTPSQVIIGGLLGLITAAIGLLRTGTTIYK